MGNRIFAAAVIMMTIPITAVAAVTSLYRFPRPPDTIQSKENRWPLGLALLGSWVAELAIQFLDLLFTFSRGPWMGCLFALAVMVVLVAVFVGRKGVGRLAVVLGLAPAITVIVFLIPRPAVAPADPSTPNEAGR